MSRVAIAPFLAQHVRYLSENPNQLLIEYTGMSDRWFKMASFFRDMDRYALGNIAGAFGSFEIMKREVNALNNLIDNAPKVPRTFIVWRGTGNFEIPIVNGRFTMNGFSGASLEPRIAAGFAENTQCCLYRLELPPNSPFLLIGLKSKLPHEFEVMLPLNSVFEYLGETREEIEGQTYRVIQGRYIEHGTLSNSIPDPRTLPFGIILIELTKTRLKQEAHYKQIKYDLLKCGAPNTEYRESCNKLNEEMKQRALDALKNLQNQYFSTQEELLALVDPSVRASLLLSGGAKRRRKQTRRQRRRGRGRKTYRRI